jgi:Domain of unknown function (DUF222)
MTSSAAGTAVCVGEQVEWLDKSAAAMRQGGIGFAHLGLLARTAAAISGSASATAVFNETKLLAKAEYLSVPAFRAACLKVRHAADREAFLAQQLQEREWRTLTLAGGADGTVEIFGLLDCEGGALLRAALDPLAEAAGPDDERPPGVPLCRRPDRALRPPSRCRAHPPDCQPALPRSGNQSPGDPPRPGGRAGSGGGPRRGRRRRHRAPSRLRLDDHPRPARRQVGGGRCRSLRTGGPGSDAAGAELPRQGLPLARLRQAGPLSVPNEVALAGPGSRAEPS